MAFARWSSLILSLTVALSAQAEKLVVGLGELDYPPFYYTETGELQGAAVTIAEDLAAELGHQLEYRRFPWPRVQFFLKTGGIDMVILYFQTPDRAEYVYYTDQPHLFEASYLAVPHHLAIEFDGDLRSLRDYDFVAVRGYSHGDEFNNGDYLNVIRVSSETELLRTLVTRRPFIGVGNKPALTMHAEKMGVRDKIRFLTPPIDRSPDYIAFSRARPDAEALAAEFSRAFENYRNTERYLTVLDRYGFEPPRTQ